MNKANFDNKGLQFCDFNKDKIPDFIFNNKRTIEVVDGQNGAVLLSHNWRRKGSLYIIDTSNVYSSIFYCLENYITAYKDKKAQVYSNYKNYYGFPFVNVGAGFALAVNSNVHLPPFYDLYKMPKAYKPNPKLNGMELRKPTILQLPGYYSSSFFVQKGETTLIGIATNMGIIALYNQNAQLAGLYQGPKGLISLELKEKEGIQDILIKTNRRERYYYKAKTTVRLWQGDHY